MSRVSAEGSRCWPAGWPGLGATLRQSRRPCAKPGHPAGPSPRVGSWPVPELLPASLVPGCCAKRPNQRPSKSQSRAEAPKGKGFPSIRQVMRGAGLTCQQGQRHFLRYWLRDNPCRDPTGQRPPPLQLPPAPLGLQCAHVARIGASLPGALGDREDGRWPLALAVSLAGVLLGIRQGSRSF